MMHAAAAAAVPSANGQQAPGAGDTTAAAAAAAQQPATTRPHDARTIHLILASVGVTAYQERVPLQLLDFAYRYTSGILGDAAHLAAEGYAAAEGPGAGPGGGGGGGTGGGRGKGGGGGHSKQSNEGDVTLPALRLATSGRLGHQFTAALPKQALLEVAEERNRVRLPDVSATKVFGVRLPEERFLLSNRHWTLLEEEDDEDEAGGDGDGDDAMGGHSLATTQQQLARDGAGEGAPAADGTNGAEDENMSDFHDEDEDDETVDEHINGNTV